MPELNAHQLFTDSSSQIDFLRNITLEELRVESLRKARDEIRDTLKTACSGWENHIRQDALFENSLASSKPGPLRPKFRMQGSMAYKTLNEPAHVPPQQIDVDDGLFLPVSFYDKHGNTSPVVAMKGIFALVETALQPLCDDRGWILNADKPTCVRVELDTQSHVDIAIYAIPDVEFTRMAEALAQKQSTKTNLLLEATELEISLYDALKEDQIMLAHREEGWKLSDPRKLEQWFQDAVNQYGKQLRRVCRYFKAWRDHQWNKCALSSIALMKCVVDVYASDHGFDEKRDDLAIKTVADKLPGLLNSPIENPVVEGQFLDESWSGAERANFIEAAHILSRNVQSALDSGQAIHLIRYMREGFGDRIPDDPDLVRANTASASMLSGLAAKPEISRAVIKEKGDRYA